MGMIENIINIIKGYDNEENEVFPGAREDEDDFRTPAQMNREKAERERKVSRRPAAPAVTEKPQPEEEEIEDGAPVNILGNLKFGSKKPRRPSGKGAMSDEILVFAPTNLNEMLGLKEYLEARISVILKLDGLSEGMDRRLLDFASGMAYGLDGKLSPISGKTYLVSPRDVNLVQQNGAVETDERFF